MPHEMVPSSLASTGVSDTEQEYTLEALLAGVTDDNRHPEFGFGPPVGKEVVGWGPEEHE